VLVGTVVELAIAGVLAQVGHEHRELLRVDLPQAEFLEAR